MALCFNGAIIANHTVSKKECQRSIDNQARQYANILEAQLKPLACSMRESVIIGKNERDELQLAWLAEKLNKTKTIFGRWALQHSLNPVSDLEIIYARQSQLKKMVEDTSLYDRIGAHLDIIKQSENCLLDWNTYTHEITDEEIEIPVFGGLLAYWDQDQNRNSEKLFHAIKGLYYTLPGTQFLNKYTSALEASMFLETGRTGIAIASTFGADGLRSEFNNWTMGAKHPGDEKPTFNWIRGVKKGFTHVTADFDPHRSTASENYNERTKVTEQNKDDEKHNPSAAFYETVFIPGSTWGDRYHAFKTNYDSTSPIELYHVGKLFHKIPFLGNVFSKKGQFEYKTYQYEKPNLFIKAIAAAGATSFAAYPVYFKFLFTRQYFSYWNVLFKATRRLQRHMVQVMKELRSIVSLRAIVNKTPELQDSCIAEHLRDVFSHASPALKELFALAGSSTFSADAFIFSRGRVLHAHRLLKQVRDELAPALQAIGELDAMHTMATHYKDNLDTHTSYSFAQFENHAEAMVSFTDCWIPVVEGAVPNSVAFGQGHPNKLIITGPNGGGKSTFLKALGHGVVLAQSWGIVPASNARMTVIDAIYTCLHPQESLKDAMSTFMAEKYRVDQIAKQVQMHRSDSKKVMLLLDEPFKGTVDAESAERIYNFGLEVSGLAASIVCIATHVHKPIMLAEDTNKAFSNFHVVISEIEKGQFKREFRIEEGVAYWWFDDIAKRSRFIDWLGEYAMQMKYKKAA